MWTAWNMVSSSITGFTIFSCVFHCFQKEQSSMWTAWSMVSSSITGFTIFSCVFHCFRRSRAPCELPEVWSPQVLLVSLYFPVCFIVSEEAEFRVNCLQPCLLKNYCFHHIFLCFHYIFLCFSPYFPVFFHCFRRSRVSCELPAAVSPEVLLGSEYPWASHRDAAAVARSAAQDGTRWAHVWCILTICSHKPVSLSPHIPNQESIEGQQSKYIAGTGFSLKIDFLYFLHLMFGTSLHLIEGNYEV